MKNQDSEGSNNFLEGLWDGLLSREPSQVLQAWATLKPSEQKEVLSHLKRMATEPGWHPEQKASAAMAIHVLGDKG